jgi:prepilin-type N-terminal cleavage/methylation domain-containing protein/prepilin-type processing-associated H-X9-DG protein
MTPNQITSLNAGFLARFHVGSICQARVISCVSFGVGLPCPISDDPVYASMKPQPALEKGFSLVELLVVIAIISLLAAMILPALRSTKRKAQRIHCAHNLGQLGLALQGFVSDSHAYPLQSEGGMHWPLLLESSELSGNHSRIPVFSDRGVWRCPSAGRPASIPKTAGYLDYGYNVWGLSPWGDPAPLGLGASEAPSPSGSLGRPVVESSVTRPAEMMALGDGFRGGGGIIQDGVSALWRTSRPEDYSGSTKRSYSRHYGSANLLFCDGHIQSLSLVALFGDSNEISLQRWNRDHQAHRERIAQ